MLDRIWEFFLSDDKIDRLLSRCSLLVALLLLWAAVVFLTIPMLIGLGAIIAVVIIVMVMISRAEKKAEEEYQKLLKEDDDGVTGYVAVRPEELEGPPWEVRKPKKTNNENIENIKEDL